MRALPKAGKPWEVPRNFGGIEAVCRLGAGESPTRGQMLNWGQAVWFPVGRADPAAVDQMAAGIAEGGSARSKPPSTGFHELYDDEDVGLAWGEAGQRVIAALSPEQPSFSSACTGKAIPELAAWLIPAPPHSQPSFLRVSTRKALLRELGSAPKSVSQ